MRAKVYGVVQEYQNLRFGHITENKICLHSTEAGAVGCAFVKGRKPEVPQESA